MAAKLFYSNWYSVAGFTYVWGPNSCEFCELAWDSQVFPLNSYIFVQHYVDISARLLTIYIYK